jgi:hypothetical protein
MDIIYASGPDHKVISKDDGTLRPPAVDQRADDSLRGKSYNIRDDEAWQPQTSGEAPRSSAARGAIFGVLLGMILWGIILVLIGVIKL